MIDPGDPGKTRDPNLKPGWLTDWISKLCIYEDKEYLN